MVKLTISPFYSMGQYAISHASVFIKIRKYHGSFEKLEKRIILNNYSPENNSISALEEVPSGIYNWFGAVVDAALGSNTPKFDTGPRSLPVPINLSILDEDYEMRY